MFFHDRTYEDRLRICFSWNNEAGNGCPEDGYGVLACMLLRNNAHLAKRVQGSKWSLQKKCHLKGDELWNISNEPTVRLSC